MTPEETAKDIVMRCNYGASTTIAEEIAQALRDVRNEALDQVLATISREQSIQECREDDDGNGLIVCKELASYVRALKAERK